MSTPLLATILVVIACVTVIMRELMVAERLREVERMNRECADRQLEHFRIRHHFTMQEIEASRSMHREWQENQKRLEGGDEPWRG